MVAKNPKAKAAESEADKLDRDTSGAGSLADLAGTGGGSFEGELATMESIENRRHIFLDFKLMPSSFKEGGTYACMSIELGGKKAVVNSNAMVILKGLAVVDKSKLPAPNAFVKRMGKQSKKPYWDFASAEELSKLK